MNKSMQKLKKNISLAIILVLLLLPCSVFAAEAGSLQIVLKEGGVQVALYPVASADGTLSAEFAAVDISADRMLAEKYGRKNAKILYQYALSENVAGTDHTTDSNGVTHYTDLAKGIYLIACADEQEVDFIPFLVKVPTVINGEAQYYLKATPKTITPGDSSGKDPEPEDPKDQENIKDPDVPRDPSADASPGNPTKPIPEPEVPNHTLEMDDPIIPQTGAVRYPIWLLNGFGTLCIVVGILQLRKAEPEDFEDLDEEDMLDEEA